MSSRATLLADKPAAARGIARDHASLIVHGADRPGIVAAVAAVLSGHGANIVSLDQYSDNPEGGAFFQRTVFSVPDLTLRLPEIEESLSEQGRRAASASTSRCATCRCRNGWRSSRPSPITACSTCCGGRSTANWRSPSRW